MVNLVLVISVIFILSFILSLLSMKDLDFADELKKVLEKEKIKGVLVFFRNKIIHYHRYSSSSESSSKGVSG